MTGPKAAGLRITVEEAAVLQSFPPGYPWSGTKTAKFRQIGDAVPPALAAAVLAPVLAAAATSDIDAHAA
ncbi:MULTISPECIES: DNA cytosine methyltransferase [Nocardia]|uniref:DNA cytosine methyltransferase n=1 Tax=Nocardia TaxID=1817 RepID=UPI00313DEE1C